MFVAFVHPDLGIGGAERLIVDAAVGLQNSGHNIVVYTSHHSADHCFSETISSNVSIRLPYTQHLHLAALRVIVKGRIRNPFKKRFQLFFAILRNLILSLSLLFQHYIYRGSRERIDVFVVDQLSVSIPILRLIAPVVFYGHYP